MKRLLLDSSFNKLVFSISIVGVGLLATAPMSALAQSTLLIPDSSNARVFRYNIDSQGAWTFAGVFADAADGSNMIRPESIAFDGNSTVYIGDVDAAGSSRILRYHLNGSFEGVLTTFFGERPDKIVIAPDGNLFVSDPFGTGFPTDQIIKVDVSTGAYSTFIQPGDPLFFDTHQLVNPRSMAVVGSTLYVANRNGMGGGGVSRFDANTGAHLDANIGPDSETINDDLFLALPTLQSLTHDSATNTLYVAGLAAGPDVFAVNLSAIGAPPLGEMSDGVTRILDLAGGNRIFLDLRMVNGRLYTTSFNENSVWEIIPATEENPEGSRILKVTGISQPNQMAQIPFQAVDPVGVTWTRSGFGDWGSAGNWFGGVVPDFPEFGGAIAGDSTVFTNEDVTVKGLRFDSANRYAIAGHGSINLAATSGDAVIEVLQGSHELQTPVTLMSDTAIDVAAGAALAFNGLVDLNGFTLTYSGDVVFNQRVLLNGGALAPNGSLLSVPEPGAWLLAACGLSALLCRRGSRLIGNSTAT